MLNDKEIKELANMKMSVIGDGPIATGLQEVKVLSFHYGYTLCQEYELPEIACRFLEWADANKYTMDLAGRWAIADEPPYLTTTELFKQYLECLEKQKEGV